MALLRFSTAHDVPACFLPAHSLYKARQILPLSKRGRDDPSNMQWLSREEHQNQTRRDLQP